MSRAAVWWGMVGLCLWLAGLVVITVAAFQKNLALGGAALLLDGLVIIVLATLAAKEQRK